MKIVQISDHIWRLHTWLIYPLNVWVVQEEDGITLVDTGISLIAKNIVRSIERLGLGPLRTILLTHGHPDHAGGIKRILETHQVPVYVHRIEIPYIEGKLSYSSGKKAVASAPIGTIQEFLEDDFGQLQPIGSLTPYLAPGHSPGHVVLYHEQDQVLLSGDLFTSKNGKLWRPMPRYTADMQEAIRSSAIVGKLHPKILEVSHGGPVLQAADQLASYIARETK